MRQYTPGDSIAQIFTISICPAYPEQKKNRLRSDRAALQHILASAYCCFRQDLTGFTPEDRTGPDLHRANGKSKYTRFLSQNQEKTP